MPEFHNFGEAAVYFYKCFAFSSPDRFDRYLTAANGQHIEAMVLYRWNLQLCEALVPCLHSAELTLRNAIHRAMIQKYLPGHKPHFRDGSHPDDWWFDSTFNGSSVLGYGDSLKLRDAEKRLISDGKPITTSNIVAELPFGFWVELLNKEYEQSIIIPALQTTMKTLSKERQDQGWLRDNFGKLKDLRNRASHHRPIFHRTDLVELNDIAWSISRELQGFFVSPLKPMCRFKSVYAMDKSAEIATLKQQIRKGFYEPHQKITTP